MLIYVLCIYIIRYFSLNMIIEKEVVKSLDSDFVSFLLEDPLHVLSEGDVPIYS